MGTLKLTFPVFYLKRLRTTADGHIWTLWTALELFKKAWSNFQHLIALVASRRAGLKGRLCEDYIHDIVKYISLTARYSNFFTTEPCRFFRVQTRLSTSSQPIKSDTTQISIFINLRVNIFCNFNDSGKTNRRVSLWRQQSGSFREWRN